MEEIAQNGRGSWTLLTGHGHVLIAIKREPKARLRDISIRVGLTERAVQLIVADLVAEGYLVRHRVGRRNHYTVNTDSGFRHPDQDGHQVGPLLDLLATAAETDGQANHAPGSRNGHKGGIASYVRRLGDGQRLPDEHQAAADETI